MGRLVYVREVITSSGSRGRNLETNFGVKLQDREAEPRFAGQQRDSGAGRGGPGGAGGAAGRQIYITNVCSVLYELHLILPLQ